MRKIRLLTILLLLFSGCVEKQQNQAFFCPQEDCEERVIIAINNAETSIDAAIYSFTSEEIASSLTSANNNGIRVRVITDYLQSASKSSQDENLTEKGINLRVTPKGNTMHNKFMIIDNELVVTGSYNWTKNANTSNFENIVFIFDQKLAEKYEKEFFELWVKAN
ncbi:MAG: phospholipase D-like domain-containing protein [archaeon]|nr:phospholipase D-like domain-containing protein [archaeon]